MTLVVVLMLGLGVALVVSSIETDPATGRSVSLVQTFQDIWNDKVNFSQPQVSSGNPGSSSSNSPGWHSPWGPGGAGSPGLPGSPGGVFVGGAAGTAAQYDNYRAAVLRAQLQAQRQQRW